MTESGRPVDPRQVEVVAPPVVVVPVVALPPERRARMVLARLGPFRQPVDVVPAAARAGDDVHRRADRVLAVVLVDGLQRVAVGDADVVLRAHVADVGQQAGVDALAGEARNRHDATAADELAQAADRSGRTEVVGRPEAGQVGVGDGRGQVGALA